MLFTSLMLNDMSLLAQDRKLVPDSDSTSLLPSAMEICPVKISLDTNNSQVEIKVQYTVQGQTIFILPAYVAGKVERVIEGKVIPLKPGDRLLPADEKRPVRLHVTVNNMLDYPEHEKAVVDQIKKRVLEQQSLDPTTKFQIKRPIIKTEGIRFSLITAGLGNESSPAEVSIGNQVSRPLNGVLTFNLDPLVIQKVEKENEYESGLICSALSVLPTGQMKVKFERLEMDGQVSYLRATIDDFRKRVGSIVNPSTNQTPDLVIPLGAGGTAEIKNQLSSMLRQSLQVTVSTRQGGADLPLMPFLEKAIDSMLELSKIDMQNDQQRAAFLLENQVTINSTIGEIKRVSKLDEKSRTDALKRASDHYYANRKDQKSNYTGSLNVGYLGDYLKVGAINLKVGATSGVEKIKSEENDSRIIEEKEQQKQAFDKLLQEFDGKVPTLSGIKIDDTSLTSSTKQIETRFQQNTFFVDYTLQRFSPISLSGAIDGSISLTDMVRQYAILKSDYDALQKVVGTATQLAEAKENIKRLENLAEELKHKSSALDVALSAFEKNSKDLLAKVDQEAIIKLQKEVRKLKALASLTYSNSDSAFTNLDKDEQPPGLDCLDGVITPDVILSAQKAWAKFHNKNSHLDSVSITEDGKIKIDMVLIPPGKFRMGSPDSEKGRSDDEKQHEVTLTKPYYMGKYEVTQEQWKAVMGDNPSRYKGENLPVENVSWKDCQEFIKKLNAKTNMSYRLPTEAEWEYACRAGTTTPYAFGNNITPKDVNYFESNIGKTSVVGSYKANAFGLYDMHGNLWEWCEDWYSNYGGWEVKDPKGSAIGYNYVIRGGYFGSLSSWVRSSVRHFSTPATGDFNIGLRLVRNP